ncbi:DUF805 domain-containing protein [Acidithiobacillus ferridurans]|uniref:DUF805 domain-containing protein n=1 Tax=Acidithiobacillus ferridurans TaxID=1232575 RepID=A0A8X8GDH8_ACIFI|nr:DUF805 domain-containing protein [Acidithiobacillus ferridurans]MBU2715841.1 DUF805 domain-containing protein [Acidithiobacillus ferridurans]MBU2722838.1 DUF805 domain-containing protein [Acidithiobacillus ferridurans]MBU2727775.1 DUF805 domain-containing protein [Acidithiobacillus ferridurans]
MSIQHPQHWYEWYPYIIFHHYADLNGCAARPEYWYSFLAIIFLDTIGDVLLYMLYPMHILYLITHAVTILFTLAVFCPNIAVLVRRLHDVNKSAWYILLEFVPVIGWLWLLFILAQPSVMEGNRYRASQAAGAT